MDIVRYIWRGLFKSVSPEKKCTYDECICKLNNVKKRLEDLPIKQ